MKCITKLNDRERRYFMWKLVQEAVAHLDARAAEKRARRAAPGPIARKMPAPLEFELPDAAKHPLR